MYKTLATKYSGRAQYKIAPPVSYVSILRPYCDAPKIIVIEIRLVTRK